MNNCALSTTGHILFSILKGVRRCLNFWYHMHGSNIGTLNVLVDGSTVWTRKGNQGNSWKRAEITIRRTMHYKVKPLHVQYIYTHVDVD